MDTTKNLSETEEIKKFPNNFDGFTHLLDNDSIRNVFLGWLTKAEFDDNFSPLHELKTEISKDKSNVMVGYYLTFDTFKKYRDIDINYATECVKYEIPYDNVYTETMYINSPLPTKFFDKLTNKPKYRHQILIKIPFTL